MVALGILGSVALCGGAFAGTQTGAVSAFGHVQDLGAPNGNGLSAPIVEMAATADGKGYWLLGADGGVFTFGHAAFYGSEAGRGALTPFVGIAPTWDGRGYWITGDFGNVYNFGDASNEPSFAGLLHAPVVGIASNPKAMGYWLAAADGGVFTFGHTAFHGSLGNVHLNAPIVGIAATPTGRGYWLAAADGGVFSFGDARFYGSAGNHPPGSRTPVVAIAAPPHDVGYWLATTAKQLPPPTPVPAVLADCNLANGAPTVEPNTIVLACADGNALLTHLSWSSWTTTGAAGGGFFTHNTCAPDCARGTFVSVPARVQLSYPVETSAGKEFATVTYTYADASGHSNTVTAGIATSPG